MCSISDVLRPVPLRFPTRAPHCILAWQGREVAGMRIDTPGATTGPRALLLRSSHAMAADDSARPHGGTVAGRHALHLCSTEVPHGTDPIHAFGQRGVHALSRRTRPMPTAARGRGAARRTARVAAGPARQMVPAHAVPIAAAADTGQMAQGG
jgi:hypothetical protein